VADKLSNWTHTRQSCLEWKGLLDKDGYGRVKVDGESKRIHRAFYEAWFAVALKDSDVLLHSCDNPQCFNPHHLTVGTQKENVADMDKKGRRVNASSSITVCPHGHPYTKENTLVYRDGKRRCKTCRDNAKRTNNG
jgi:hypothetical protein